MSDTFINFSISLLIFLQQACIRNCQVICRCSSKIIKSGGWREDKIPLPLVMFVQSPFLRYFVSGSQSYFSVCDSQSQ